MIDIVKGIFQVTDLLISSTKNAGMKHTGIYI